MSFTQVKFLGASVTSFNSSIGWNGQESRLEVSLVEDTRNGDVFTAPAPGTPVKFEYGSFIFGGLLENFNKNGTSGGSPLYSVTVVDPRGLLNGVNVILSEYAGPTVGVPNVLNVYGYLESFGFGSSGLSEAGLPWTNISSAIGVLLNSGSSFYGGFVSYKGFTFGVYIDNLPLLPSYFRIGGVVTFMDLIQIVCDAAGLDFFVELIDDIIYIRTINKNFVPQVGVIERFVSQTPGAVSKNIGQTMVNEPVGKFLVGGKKKELFYQYYDAGTDGDESTGSDNSIWWFFGFDGDGNPILSDGLGSDLVFTLDSRAVSIPGVGDSYKTSIDELKAALAGQEAWESYLSIMNNLDYLWNPQGQDRTLISASRASKLYYSHNGVTNPHKGKFTRLNMAAGMDSDGLVEFIKNISDDVQGDPRSLIYLLPRDDEAGHDKLYNLVRNFAEEYYGRKIMVKVPPLRRAIDQESLIEYYNYYPADGGYVDSSNISTFISNDLLPVDVGKISNDDNTIGCFARFDNIRNRDLTDFSEDSLLFNSNISSIFIPCSVGNEVFFINNEARIVVEISSVVKTRGVSDSFNSFLFQFINSCAIISGLSDANSSEFSENVIRRPTLSDFFNGDDFQTFVLPDLVAIPLESQTLRYGPWYAAGANGSIEFETDENLTPWIYGGYQLMDLAASAKVNTNTAQLQVAESGSIEFPGAPTNSLGNQLMQSGPYISNIQVSVDSTGVKTSYRMETWKNKFGILNKAFADKVQRLGKIQSRIIRNSRAR